jgi:hypothetical protein
MPESDMRVCHSRMGTGASSGGRHLSLFTSPLLPLSI